MRGQKVWSDVKRIYENRTYRTGNSEWWLEGGVKIERFDDGRIEIMNCLSSGDRYDPIEEYHWAMFHDLGWKTGVAWIQEEHWRAEVERHEDLVEYAESTQQKAGRSRRLKSVMAEHRKAKEEIEKCLKQHANTTNNNQS